MPHRWSNWQDAVVLKHKSLVSWEMGEHEYELHGGTSRLTGEQSIITIPSIIGVKSKFSRRHKVPALTADNLMRRDLHICCFCGRFCRGESATMDHIVPVSKGGQHSWTNVVCACKRCNNRKGNSLLKDTDMEMIYVPYTPNQEENLILRNRAILFDQMEYLSQFLPEHSRARKLL
jgi:5-methylcytosine-specific restriction endonuclease McrA